MSRGDAALVGIFAFLGGIVLVMIVASDKVSPPKFGDDPTLRHCYELGGVEYHQDQGGLSTCVWRK